MHFSEIHNFSNTHTRKYVRFKRIHVAENFNMLANNKRLYAARFTLNRGDIGLIYRVNGATIFIGFGENLKTPPEKYMDISRFAAHITLTIHDIEKIEIEA